MKLEKIIIKNFRNYSGGDNVIDFSSDITAFIGKNDAGKSTIFDALDIFLNDAKPEINDLSIDVEERQIIISCVFSDIPDEIVIDSTAKTKLNEEYLLNKDGFYEVKKIYRCTDKSVSGPEFYIKALYPTNEKMDDLHKLNLEALKSRGAEMSVEAEDKRKSNSWRKAIWSSAENIIKEEIDLKVEDFDDKAQKIYKNLVNHYPLYFLFKSDRQTTDSDPEAKDPIQVAVKEAQREYESEIERLKVKIQEKVENVTEKALEKLQEMDANLANQLKPVLKSNPKWSFDYKIEDERGVSINKRGSGTRRMVLLNFFRAEVEQKSSQSGGNIIYAIEEPETSQHPKNQKLIIDSLLELAKDSKRQVFITTHSPELLEKMPDNSIRFIDNIEKNPVIFQGSRSLVLSADSLGILSNQKFGSAKTVVLVEAMADCVFLEHTAKLLKEIEKIEYDFNDLSILTLPLGGIPQIKTWIEKNKAENLGLNYCVFIDSDKISEDDASENANEELCESWKRDGIIVFCTRKREIENYIPKEISCCDYGDYDDAKLIISKANNVRQNKVLEKYWLNVDESQILECCKYEDSGRIKYELLELINEITKISK